MRNSLRRTAVATAATVLSGLSFVPLAASPAHAATPTEVQFLAADLDGSQDGFTGLYRRATPSGTRTAVINESPYIDVTDLTASRDGSRFAFVLNSYNTSFTLVSQKLMVADVSGRLVRTVEQVAAGTYRELMPALSPDGTTLVWTRETLSSGATVLLRGAVDGTSKATLGQNYGNAVYLDPTTLLVEDLQAGPWYTLPAAGGGTAQAASTVPANAWQPTVSVDGLKIAWSLYTGAGPTFDIQVGTLGVSGGAATVTGITTLATGLDNEHPSFSRDGSTVSFIKYDAQAVTLKLYTVPTAGGTATADTTVPGDVWEAAYGVTDDGVAPGDPTAGVATLTGTTATLRWTLPADSDLSGVLLSRTGAPTVYVPARLTSGTVTGLTLGTTYTFTITTVDRSGNLGTTPATRQLTAVQALPTASAPTSTTSNKTWFPVRLAPGAVPSTVTFDVSYRGAGRSWTVWVANKPGVSRFFGTAATSTQTATASAPGNNFQFRVTAHDAYGNSTPNVIGTWAVVPWDQTKASFNSGTTYALSSAYLGSYRVLKAAGSYANIAVNGARLYVVGARCPGCGVFDVYIGSTRIGTVDSYRSSTVQRSVLFTKYFGSGYRVVTIRARGTAGRPNVILDAFGIQTLA